WRRGGGGGGGAVARPCQAGDTRDRDGQEGHADGREHADAQAVQQRADHGCPVNGFDLRGGKRPPRRSAPHGTRPNQRREGLAAASTSSSAPPAAAAVTSRRSSCLVICD